MKLPRGTLGVYSLYALLILFSANFLNYMDRYILGAVEKGIRGTLNIDESDVGWVASAFTIGYIITAPIIGAAADRMRRTWVLGGCVLIWSLATMACALATSFWTIFIPRVLIGVGEAGCLAVGPALAADYFSRETRGRALGFFFLGLPVGGAAGYLVGALFAQNWKWAFVAAGAPGLVLALLAMYLREPPRGSDEHGHHEPLVGFKPYLELLKTPTFLLIVVAQACAAFVLVPLSLFGPEFLDATKPLTAGQANAVMGAVALVAGIGGTTLGGWLGDRLAKREPGSYALIAGLGFGLAFASLTVGIQAKTTWIFIPAFILTFAMFFGCMPSVNAQIANVTAPNERSMAFALATLGTHLLGDTLSTPLFGRTVELYGRQWAFSHFPIALVLASALCLVARYTARRDVARVLSS